MHLLAVASRTAMSEKESKRFMFETSCYAFEGRIRCIEVSSGSFKLTVSGYIVAVISCCVAGSA